MGIQFRNPSLPVGLFFKSTLRHLGIGAVPTYNFEVWSNNNTPTSSTFAIDADDNAPLIKMGAAQTIGNVALELRNRLDLPKFRFDTNATLPSYLCADAGQKLGVGGSPNTSCKLDIQSTSYGFAPPRMTTAQKNAISTPTEGLIVYDLSTHKLCVYTGATWETITSA